MSTAKIIASTIAAVLLVLAIVIGGTFAGWWFSNSTANTRGNVSVHNQINANGAYRIADYDHFFNLCAQVQNDETQITNITAVMKTTSDAQTKQQYQAGILAAENDRANAIHQYNVDSQESHTKAQFKDSNLPYQLDTTATETTCTASN